MASKQRSISVPKEMQERYDQIVALTDGFCSKHLNEEYRELAHYMTAALCRKRPSPIATGKPLTWACSIVYALGQINFLSDPSMPVHMRMADVCSAFKVGQSTASAKCQIILKSLNANRIDPNWTLQSLAGSNPLMWMFEIKGMLVDIRHAPREIQALAFEKGLIPYIPADQKE